MSAAPAIFRVRCHYCSRWRNPSEVDRLSGGVAMCRYCLEWHRKAVHTLATGTPPDGCQECGLTFQELNVNPSDGNTHMLIVAKDGIYQILCEPCAAIYERKRLDLFGDTEYGAKKMLKGAK